MPQSGALGPGWREILDKHQTALAADLASQLHLDLDEAVAAALAEERGKTDRRIAAACADAKRAQSEALNQALRRLRLAPTGRKTLELLNEVCGGWAQRSVALQFATGEDGATHAISVAGRGLERESGVGFVLDGAPAVASALEAREPLVTLAASNQISPELAGAFGGGGDHDGYDKAYLFPLVTHGAATAMLVACGTVEAAQLELLAEAAAMRLESLTRPAGDARGEAVRGPAWEELSTEDQNLHLKAQRAARVRVAEIRLSEEAALRRGLVSGSVYDELQGHIDGARRDFLQTFLSQSPTMVDYLHLEMVRSLASGDAKLMGSNYPGPLA